MAYNGKPFFKIPRPLLLEGGVENQTIAGDITLTAKDSLFNMIDGGVADRTITLPAEINGAMYIILNTGTTNDLIIQNDAAGAIVTLSGGEVAWLVCDGTTWYPIINVNNL